MFGALCCAIILQRTSLCGPAAHIVLQHTSSWRNLVRHTCAHCPERTSSAAAAHILLRRTSSAVHIILRCTSSCGAHHRATHIVLRRHRPWAFHPAAHHCAAHIVAAAHIVLRRLSAAPVVLWRHFILRHIVAQRTRPAPHISPAAHIGAHRPAVHIVLWLNSPLPPSSCWRTSSAAHIILGRISCLFHIGFIQNSPGICSGGGRGTPEKSRAILTAASPGSGDSLEFQGMSESSTMLELS
ncbi:unnamed protein product [Pleuronectes platessa]|uniref:Secreted protein n=1 Tax=Pleuronectes platessa TaxID=8262 RepID=A0A9N7TLZ6_PLEPL|nr:unnamed protein product [Pleuronectes platessa]